MYRVILSKTAENQIDKLDNLIKNRIINTLDRIIVRPHHFVKKLVGNPYYRLRVGDYRVILDIQDDKLLILVVELGHRRNIYEQ
jgi:mRNA interferase RelE/StbE